MQITVTIDREMVQVEKGTPLIEAAEKVGILIPTLCYHEALMAYGACRLCTVEVIKNRQSQLVTSCNYPVESGIRVVTNSEKVRNIRKIVMELLLAQCPEAPVIKHMARQLGIEGPRFKVRAEHYCILCGLCVRVCDEIVGARAIGFANRGPEREVTPPFHIETDACIGCGACTYVCPTSCIDMIISESSPGYRRMRMGNLLLETCTQEYRCESCEVEEQFIEEMRERFRKFRQELKERARCSREISVDKA